MAIFFLVSLDVFPFIFSSSKIMMLFFFHFFFKFFFKIDLDEA